MSRGWLGTASSLLLALVLALMMWFVSTESERPLVTVEGFPAQGTLPVRFTGAGPNRAAYDPSAREARIALRGFPDALGSLDAGTDFRLIADLGGASSDAVTVTVPIEVHCDRCGSEGVRVLGVDPPEVVVSIGDRITETRSIYVDAPSVAPPGHVITRRAATPAQVSVSGATAALARVHRLVATVEEPVLSQGTSVFEDVGVRAVDEQGASVPDVIVRPSHVFVELTTRRRGVEVSVRPELTGVEADGYYITGVTVEPQVLQVEGQADPLAQVQATGIVRVPVDVTDAAGDIVRPIPVAEVLPPGVTAVNAPDTITVTVRLTPLPGTVTLQEVPVNVRGLDDDLDVQSTTPDRVDVLTSGPRSDLAQLALSDLDAFVDASQLGPGRHVLRVQVNAPAGFLPRSITPSTVEVVIVPGVRPTATPVR